MIDRTYWHAVGISIIGDLRRGVPLVVTGPDADGVTIFTLGPRKVVTEPGGAMTIHGYYGAAGAPKWRHRRAIRRLLLQRLGL